MGLGCILGCECCGQANSKGWIPVGKAVGGEMGKSRKEANRAS